MAKRTKKQDEFGGTLSGGNWYILLDCLHKQALDNIADPLLHLAVHIAFVCSLRVGEAMALTWDCIDFSENSIHINKTLQRASKEALVLLPTDNLLYVFPSTNVEKKSVLILKSPKTRSSVRKCFITPQLKEELLQRKSQIENQKIYFKEVYQDFNLVFALENGFPIEPKLCEKWFKKWQSKTLLNLPTIVFHEIRHSSTTYKLQISGGDIKSVQGDTGHATADMVVNTYSHILDQSRAALITTLGDTFYNQNATCSRSILQDNQIQSLLEIAKNDPNMQQLLLSALGA